MTNDQLLAAWKRKLPNVAPTDQELTAFALGVEVGEAALAAPKHQPKPVQSLQTWCGVYGVFKPVRVCKFNHAICECGGAG